MVSDPLRITFVLPQLSFSGGVRVVFEHTRELSKRGHQVQIVAPELRPVMPWSSRGREQLRRWWIENFVNKSKRNIEYFGLTSHIKPVAELEPRHFPEGDVLIATGWDTADSVAAAPQRCGRKAYFIQGYELFDAADEQAVAATWMLPLNRIVVSSWLAGIASERFQVPYSGPVFNGVNTAQFHDRGRVVNDPPVLGMVYELQALKGMDDGFEAIRLARQTVPELKVKLFGRYRMRHVLQEGDSYLRNPRQELIGDIYRSCDLFLCSSRFEGWGLPAMEAMACGCAVVSTDVGGIPDFSTPGETVLTAPAESPEALAAHIVSFAKDEDLRRRFGAAAAKHVKEFTWERATTSFEKCLREITR